MAETSNPGGRRPRTARLSLHGGLLAVLCFGPGPASAQVVAEPDSLALSGVAPQADTVHVPEAVSQERATTDEATRALLQAIFDRVASMSDVTVEVEAGVVRLRGTVAEERIAQRAEELARGQPGVVWVENRIALTTSMEERLQPTWDRLRDLGYGTIALLPLLLVAVLVVAVASLLARVVGRWGGPTALGGGNPFLRSIIVRAIQTTLVLAGLLVALDLLDATALVGAVVGTAGLAGLALGFAFKDIVENYLAGVLLALRQPFAQNDHVATEGYEGKVIRLTPRETILMTLDGNHVRLPNALVFRSPMTNFTRNPRRRFHFDVGVGSADDLSLARETGMAALREMEGVMPDPPPEALILEIGDSTVTVRFQAWVDQREAGFGRVRSEAIRGVKGALEGAGVSLPSPEYLVRISRDGGEQAVAPGAARALAAKPAEAADVSIDRAVDEQIDEDRRASGEENLLERG